MNLRFPSIVGKFLGSRVTGVFSRELARLSWKVLLVEDPKLAEWTRNFLGEAGQHVPSVMES
jgi:hypothetical protein